jgi:hypothetical protein
MTNTYYKFLPNVFLARCEEEHKKGDIIEIETKSGKINRHIVHNKINSKEGVYFYYSITREDGYNLQERAKRKAEQREQWAESAENKSMEYYKKGNKDSAFLSLGEPIKVGHHSEKKHRKIIEQAQNNATKSCEFSDKAKEHKELAEYWKTRENDINLSIPESLEFYSYKFEEAKKEHEFFKNNPDKREHSYSLTYAKKAMNEAEKKLEQAKVLWC